jgi:hypothetical protein
MMLMTGLSSGQSPMSSAAGELSAAESIGISGPARGGFCHDEAMTEQAEIG